eukprot:scaffold123499_cov20-Tisochrysis_lutea.AAC.2
MVQPNIKERCADARLPGTIYDAHDGDAGTQLQGFVVMQSYKQSSIKACSPQGCRTHTATLQRGARGRLGWAQNEAGPQPGLSLLQQTAELREHLSPLVHAPSRKG